MNPDVVSCRQKGDLPQTIIPREVIRDYLPTWRPLTPNLDLFTATVANYYHEKNVAFAAAIVDLIAMRLTQDPPELDTAYVGYGYQVDRNGNSKWDELIGYSAGEVFTTLQEGTILRLVGLDLMKRGFKVFSLKLWRSSLCYTRYPDDELYILVSWRLGYNALSEPTDLDSRGINGWNLVATSDSS